MPVDIILGLQWGDEGKGKIVDVLASDYDVVARFQGGPNAGHTIIFNGKKYVLHLIPSGIFYPQVKCLVGNGVVLDPVVFKSEIDKLHSLGFSTDNLFLSKRATLILPTHKLLDAVQERKKGDQKIGSTLRGIGPAYQDKTGRMALKLGSILEKDFELQLDQVMNIHLDWIRMMDPEMEVDLSQSKKDFLLSIEMLKNQHLVDSEMWLYNLLKEGKKVLAEGAQGSLLDVDFGTYPYVTSSNTIAGGCCTGLGISPKEIRNIIGVFKAYTTRVGSGPFPTELNNAEGEEIRVYGHEFGATTGRPRRVGWLDLPALRYACRVNGVTHLLMMKCDVLSIVQDLKVCTHYKTPDGLSETYGYGLENPETVQISVQNWYNHNFSDKILPNSVLDYVDLIEKETGIPIAGVSVGPDRSETIMLKEW